MPVQASARSRRPEAWWHALTGLLAVGAVAVCAPAATALVPLGAYNADPGQVSVSGFSSGGFMAQQLGVAYSSRFMGVGVFAGGIYDCWRSGNPGCGYPNTPSIVRPEANMNAWSGSLIDPVSNIARQKIYVFVGTNDMVVGPNTTDQVVNLYKDFTASSNIHYDNTVPASHAFPTDYDTVGTRPCGVEGITNCGFDGAGTALQWIYGPLNPPNTGTLSGSLIQFNQGAFVAPGNGMDSEGWLFVPASCASGQLCRLHVALHGCSMNYSQHSVFNTSTGYNRWADTNNIIILYPQTIADALNSPNPANQGCWDGFAFYGLNYDQKGGVQVEALMSMVTQITSGFVPSAATTLAVEYYYDVWNFYFETSFPDEIAALDGGAFGGAWKRTGQSFNVWPQSNPSAAPTCRFFSTAFAPKSAHFYTPFASECALVKTEAAWQYEALAFYIALADANGLCGPGTIPLYRLYNNGMGGAPNHRYTTSLTVFNQMAAAGWIFEGNGNTKVFACVPQ